MPEMPDPVRVQRLVAVLLLTIGAIGLTDVLLDGHPLWSLHFIVEIAKILVSLGTAIYLFRNWARATTSLAQVRSHLAARRQERDAWRRRAQRLLTGLGQVIDEQLRDWRLTPAERDTAMMILKGLSHREIAEMCGKSDRTVRQHAASVYRKSGLAGRAELSAFFLEDLLVPADQAVVAHRPTDFGMAHGAELPGDL